MTVNLESNVKKGS